VARNRMSTQEAQALAEKLHAQYPDASSEEIWHYVNNPSVMKELDAMRVLEDYHEGFRVPPGTPEERQRYRDAIDQRLHSQPLRERRREELERVGATDAFRRRVADVVKPVSMAASVTPYDLGLGDVGYAAGELIDPEGTYGDAALAAAGGVLTGGLGSGALMTKAAKEARKGIKRADDFEDLIPTKIIDIRDQFAVGQEAKRRAARRAKAHAESLRTPSQIDPSMIQKQTGSRFGTSAPYEVAFGVGGAAALGKLGRERLREQEGLGSWDRDREFAARKPWDRDREFMGRRMEGGDMAALKTSLESDWDLSEAASKAASLARQTYIDPFKSRLPRGRKPTDEEWAAMDPYKRHGPVLSSARNIGPELNPAQYEHFMRLVQAERTPVDPNLSVAMMNEVRRTTDYGNAFAETSERHRPSGFSSIDALSDIPDSYEGARNEAVRIYKQTGTVPPGLARSLGKHEALMTTRAALLNEDDRMLREGISFKPSMPIVESPPEEPIGPTTPEQPVMAGQGSVEEREIEPSMGYFGE